MSCGNAKQQRQQNRATQPKHAPNLPFKKERTFENEGDAAVVDHGGGGVLGKHGRES